MVCAPGITSLQQKPLCLIADSYACFVSRKYLLSAVRDVFDYSLWVDGHFVDIQGCVVRLFVGPVRFVTNIERDVREVYVIVT